MRRAPSSVPVRTSRPLPALLEQARLAAQGRSKQVAAIRNSERNFIVRVSAIISVTLVIALAACSGAMNAVPLGNSAQQPGVTLAQQPPHPSAADLGLWPRAGQAERVCADAPPGYAQCLALVRTDVHGLISPDTPAGYSPA